MKLYVAMLVLAVAIAVLGIALEQWWLIGVAVVAGFIGFFLFVRTGQGTHASDSSL